MSKVSFNGTNPYSDGKSIRDVHIEGGDRKERMEKRAERRMPARGGSTSVGGNTRTTARRSSFMLWASALVILAALVIVATFIFIGRTSVDLTVRIAHLSLSENVVHSAYKTPEAGELGFTVVSDSAEMSESVPATETKFVEQKASGKLTVYNDYTTDTQRIIKNTRFEAPDGKIYRVRNSFIVPGRTSTGGNTVPGSIEITVYADKVGEEYNKDSAKFTIPGLKGDPRYEKFWAETKTPIIGGFSGNRATVGESDLASTREKLRTKLRTQITENLQSGLNKDQNLFAGAIFYTYESSDALDETSENVVVTERASAQAIVFNASNLAEELAKESSIVLYEGSKTLVDPSVLVFSIVQKEKVDPVQDELIQFTISGDAKLIWDVDVDTLKNDLAGKPSSILDSTLAGYPGVKDAYVTIRPFWRSAFPTNTADIIITVETEQ